MKDELAGFGVCGDFGQGFVRTACRTCGDELRVPFSCKGRGLCPSCMGRRMAEGAALRVDHVLPAVGYRQWVLSFEGRAAVRPGHDRALLAEVAGARARAVMHDMRWAVKERHGLGSVEPLHAGVFMVVQRFRGDLGLFVHLHAIATDGANVLRLMISAAARPSSPVEPALGFTTWPIRGPSALPVLDPPPKLPAETATECSSSSPIMSTSPSTLAWYLTRHGAPSSPPSCADFASQ